MSGRTFTAPASLRAALGAAVGDEELTQLIVLQMRSADARTAARGLEIYLKVMQSGESEDSPKGARLNLKSVLSGSRDSRTKEA